MSKHGDLHVHIRSVVKLADVLVVGAPTPLTGALQQGLAVGSRGAHITATRLATSEPGEHRGAGGFNAELS